MQKASDLFKNVAEKFYNQRSVQYGVLGGYLLLWLIFSGSLTQTILVGIAIGLGWLVGLRHLHDTTD